MFFRFILYTCLPSSSPLCCIKNRWIPSDTKHLQWNYRYANESSCRIVFLAYHIEGTPDSSTPQTLDHRDTVLFTHVFKTVDESAVRPEVCVFSFTRADQCVKKTPLIFPTDSVDTPLLYNRSTRLRTSAFCAWSRWVVRLRYRRSIRLLELRRGSRR